VTVIDSYSTELRRFQISFDLVIADAQMVGYGALIASSASFTSVFEIGLRSLLIKTTDPMIMAAAKRMRGVNDSLANQLPRNTATTGLTSG
jgi:hypothetical protein